MINDNSIVWRDTKDILLDSSGDVTFNNTSIATVTTVTNQLTAAQIATGVWQDSTSGDFTAGSSIGKSLYTSGVVPGASGGLFIAGTNAATTITTSLTTHLVGTVDTVTTVTNQLTAAAIATGVWQDTTAGDFTTASSIGKSLYNAFTANTSVFTTAALANAPTGGSAPTAAQVATAVWQDATAGDFTVTSSIGKSLYTSGIAPGSSGGFAKIGSSPFPFLGTQAAAVWDELNTGATHNINNSTGKQLRTLAVNTGVIYTATAPSQAGMTSTQIKLDSGASSSNNVYQWDVISIIGGTNAGDSRIVTAYVGSTKVATINAAWTVQPDATSVFEITPTAATQVVSYITGQDPATLVWAAAVRTLTAFAFTPTLDLTQALSAARDVSAVADTSLTLNDALHCAIGAFAGKETVVGTTYTVKTPSTGTVLRTFTLDSASAPTSRT